LRRLCQALGVPFSGRMLSWPPGIRDSDGVWALHWYTAVARSTGFAPYAPRRAELPEPLLAVVEECRPHYEFLRERKLTL